MTQRIRHLVAALTVAIALLSLATSAPAGPAVSNLCCACTCQGSVSCSVVPPESCPVVCAQAPQQPCDFQILNSSSCTGQAPCAAAAPAPALGREGLGLVALILTAVGALTLRRRRAH
jgi:hypothetical protein